MKLLLHPLCVLRPFLQRIPQVCFPLYFGEVGLAKVVE